jgi:CHAD domain-containing protein
MENTSLTSARFVGEYEKLVERVGEALRKYLGDPNEENTRNIRASARRMDTCIGILPKKARSKAVRQRRDRSRKLLALTSEVRDNDIIRARLSGRAGDPMVDLLLKNMTEEREEHAVDSMKAAWKLFELRGPKLTKKETTRVSQWVNKALEELDKEISAELLIVVKSEGRIDELHSLRKHAKRFRYALELIPPTRRSSKVVQGLKEWQDVLGKIRDSDVVIEYLGRARPSPIVKEILSAERNFRHRRYLAFVRGRRRGPLEKNVSLLASAGLKQASSTSGS